ncbi:hypothetical protein TWF506_007594 [Arthrobotrys conoides]|uniref:Uncharacterized protein n=1 Tax=Arthrobotrys conoides TaxID=74498 RepID=A0AAN8NKJ0_9PEZI
MRGPKTLSVYSASQLFIFSQILCLTLAVPCYINSSSLTTNPDTTSTTSEQCSVTESISSSTTASISSSSSKSRRPAKTSTLIPTIKSPTPIAKPKNLTPKNKPQHPNQTPSNQTTPNSKHSPFGPRVDPVTGQGFYTVSSFEIECDSSDVVYDNFAPQTFRPDVTPNHWPIWADSDYSEDDAITAIQYEQAKCESCRCDENGLYDTPLQGDNDLRFCPDYDFVMICISVYGCRCDVHVEEKPFIDPTVVDDMAFVDKVTNTGFDMYQGQDNTRDLTLYGAFNRWWQHKTQKKGTKGSGKDRAAVSSAEKVRLSQLKNYESPDRYYVPGEKEPYFLEGPSSNRDTYYWDTLSMGTVGRSIWKRGVTAGGDKTGEEEGGLQNGSTGGEKEEEDNSDKDKDQKRKEEGGETSKNGQR